MYGKVFFTSFEGVMCLTNKWHAAINAAQWRKSYVLEVGEKAETPNHSQVLKGAP